MENLKKSVDANRRFCVANLFLLAMAVALGVQQLKDRPSAPEDWVEVLHGDQTYLYATATVAVDAPDPTGEVPTDRGDPRERAAIVGEATALNEAQTIVRRVTASLLQYPPEEYPLQIEAGDFATIVWEEVERQLPVPVFVPADLADGREAIIVVAPVPTELLARVVHDTWDEYGTSPTLRALQMAIDRLDPKDQGTHVGE